MLRPFVLRGAGIGVNVSWAAIDRELRPFVRRRVGDDTDDVMQEVLLRMHRGLPALDDPERLGPWMIAVARSAIADHGRRHARRRDIPVEEPEAVAPVVEERESSAPDPARALAGVLGAFVADLPAPYREVLELTELQGLTQREAAERLGLSLTAVKSRVARGRRQLRQSVEQCCHIALDARRRVIGMEARDTSKCSC